MIKISFWNSNKIKLAHTATFLVDKCAEKIAKASYSVNAEQRRLRKKIVKIQMLLPTRGSLRADNISVEEYLQVKVPRRLIRR